MQFHYFGDMGLNKEDASFRVKTSRQPVEDYFADVVLQFTGILHSGQGMDVNHTVDTVVLLLEGDIILYSPEVVTDVLSGSRADSGKNALLHLDISSVEKCSIKGT